MTSVRGQAVPRVQIASKACDVFTKYIFSIALSPCCFTMLIAVIYYHLLLLLLLLVLLLLLLLLLLVLNCRT